MEKPFNQKVIVFAICLAILIAGCEPSSDVSTTSTPVPTDTVVAPPTLTATAVVPLAVLLLPSDLDPEISNSYQTTVYDLAQASGLRYQVRNSLAPEEIEPGLKVVIALPPDPGVAALAAAAPDVQFLAINIPEIAPGGNISALGETGQSDIAGFLAGYTAALVTDDYRIGMLMPKDNPDAIRAFNSFNTGMKYYCGLCRTLYFYANPFPQYVEIPSDADPVTYGAYADILILQYKIGTIFVYPDIATPDLTNYIGTTGVYMIGTKTPEELPAGWVMTIQPDIIKAIQNAWPSLIRGEGGVTVQSPLGISAVDSTILSAGKLRLVEETLSELQSGRIVP